MIKQMGRDQALIDMLNPICIIGIIGLIFDILYIYDVVSNVVYQYDNHVLVAVLFIGGIVSLVITIRDINNNSCKKTEYVTPSLVHIMIFLMIILNICVYVDLENFSDDVEMIKGYKVMTIIVESTLLFFYVLNIVISYKFKHNTSLPNLKLE